LFNFFSEVYPLFKSDSVSVCDASSRICILFNDTEKRKNTDKLNHSSNITESDSEQSDLSDTEESLLNNICTQTSRPKVQEQEVQAKISHAGAQKDDKSISICVQIEEALHLPKYLSGEEQLEPNTYATCQLLDQLLTTKVVTKSVKPRWNFRNECKLDVENLRGEFLEFKVWRCAGTSVNQNKNLHIGLAKIDTSPLFYGKKFIEFLHYLS